MTEHRWPPQPGDLVKVERSTRFPTEETREKVGNIYQLHEIDCDGDYCVVDKGYWYFNLSDLSPATPPETIEQFGRTYRLVEGWQPIETAPHDGTLILVAVKHIGADVVSWSGAGWRETSNGLMLRDAPTLWMPLHPPPVTTEPSP